ncbi:MAG: IS4 family transposase, partial [Deltaproteobacteria bacterium]
SIGPQPRDPLAKGLRVRVIDGSTVQEPGSRGMTWRLHYSIELPSLNCTEVHLTPPEKGESFKRFAVIPGDVFVGDRGYAHAAGIAHVVANGGHVIVRINLSNVPLREETGESFPLLPRLKSLREGQVGDWDVLVPYQGALIPGRICAAKLSKAAREKAVRKSRKQNSKKGRVKPETLEAAQYVFVFTTLDRTISADRILESYRWRWQIELVFKRLKSLLGLGHLRKRDTESARAWIHAKLLVAFLIEAIKREARDFSPWGYPLTEEGRAIHPVT